MSAGEDAVGFRAGVLLDLDGTLVDSVFQHVIAWDRALCDAGYDVPLWRIHAGIGMGSDRLVPWLLGRHVDEVDELSKAHIRLFLDQADALRATPGANALIDDLDARDVPYVVATSAEGPVEEALLSALGRGELSTFNADEVRRPKPAPDLLLSACASLDIPPSHATLVGDSPWDAEAAGIVGVRCVTVRCGGFGDDRLLHAGAVDVVDDPRALVGRL